MSNHGNYLSSKIEKSSYPPRFEINIASNLKCVIKEKGVLAKAKLSKG